MRGRLATADDEIPGDFPVDGVHVLLDRGHHLDGLPGQRHQRLPGLGQPDGAPRPLEKLGLQVVFQGLDLVADGRLRDRQVFSRPGEALCAHRFQKDLERIYIQHLARPILVWLRG
ncbi:MAG: hypothetical protein P8Z40_12430 [Chloroflexota bacterium]